MKLLNLIKDDQKSDLLLQTQYSRKTRQRIKQTLRAAYEEYTPAQIAALEAQAQGYACCMHARVLEDAKKEIYVCSIPLLPKRFVVENGRLAGFYLDFESVFLRTDLSNCSYRHAYSDRGRDFSETVECFLLRLDALDLPFEAGTKYCEGSAEYAKILSMIS